MRRIHVALATVVLCAAAYAAGSAFETIHVFSSAADGNSPRAALVLAATGVAYGTTLYGGTGNNGTVYQLTPVSGTEKWTESVIYSFGAAPDGANPAGALIPGTGGILYGTTAAGGVSGEGTVFQLTPPSIPGAAWTETVLYSFAGAPDGAGPQAGLVIDASGILYGTTANGGNTAGSCGAAGCGTIFSLTPPAIPGAAWTETLLHSFVGPDGANPFARLTAGTSGLYYGTAVNGGTGNGVVFSLAAGAAPVVKTIHEFSGSADGANPYSELTLEKGKLYGTAASGGTSGLGTIYSLTIAGAVTVLHSFTGASDGANPMAGVFMDAGNSTLYGAASLGGANGDGTLFSLRLTSPTATFKVLHVFDGTKQSANPLATPILAPSSALLGTTEPRQVLNPIPPVADGGSAYGFCTKNPPVCAN